MKNVAIILSIIFIISHAYFPQSEKLIITGNALIGKREGGKNIRIVSGNVSISHNNSIIVCDTAYQFVEDNSALLTGNVKFKRKNLILKTEKAFYDGETRKIKTLSPFEANDGIFYLKANKGEYDADKDVINLSGEAYYRDSNKIIFCDNAFYERKNEILQVFGRARAIYEESYEIKAKRMEYYRNDKFLKAFDDVSFINLSDYTTVLAGYSEIWFDKKFAKVSSSPAIFKIDTVRENRIDTAIISANRFYYDFSANKRVIYCGDEVKFFQNELCGKADTLIFDLLDSTAISFKIKTQPIFWFENSQISADSIFAKTINKEPAYAKLYKKTLFIEKINEASYRYNQLSSDSLIVFFRDSKLNRINAYNRVLSVYYLFEDEEPNGLLKSSANFAIAFFEDGKITDVKLYNKPASEYHPESAIVNKESEFILPGFYLEKKTINKYDLIKQNIYLNNWLK